jgi:hypothetical protein
LDLTTVLSITSFILTVVAIFLAVFPRKPKETITVESDGKTLGSGRSDSSALLAENFPGSVLTNPEARGINGNGSVKWFPEPFACRENDQIASDAIEAGREIAKDADKGQLVIHRQDGTIQTEHIYGQDPYPPKG